MARKIFLISLLLIITAISSEAGGIYESGKGYHILISDFNLKLGSTYTNTGILLEASKRLNKKTDLGFIAGYNRSVTESGQYKFNSSTTTLGLKFGKLIKSPINGFSSRLEARAYCNIFKPDNTVRFINQSVTVGNNGYTFFNFNLRYFLY